MTESAQNPRITAANSRRRSPAACRRASRGWLRVVGSMVLFSSSAIALSFVASLCIIALLFHGVSVGGGKKF